MSFHFRCCAAESGLLDLFPLPSTFLPSLCKVLANLYIYIYIYIYIPQIDVRLFRELCETLFLVVRAPDGLVWRKGDSTVRKILEDPKPLT